MTRKPLNALSAQNVSQRVRSGELRSQDVLAAALARIHDREAVVRAWAHIQPAPANPDAGPLPSGPLAGVPVGIKDIIETRVMPTRWGTDYLHAPESAADAAVVALLRRAGATILGKTVCTELAYFTPGKTRNPHDPARTPGGSSSGSAAAVADGMVPLAIGTQTAGSIIRPASFCGVIGFKPTFDTVPTAGVKPFSPSLDTVGWFARTVPDIALAFAALTAGSVPDLAGVPLQGLRVGVRPLPAASPLDADAAAVLTQTRQALVAAGAQVTDLELPASFDGLVDLQTRIMAYEAARSLADEYQRYARRMGPKLLALLEQGWAVSREAYLDALGRAAAHRCEMAERFSAVDVILAPSSIGEAPLGHEATGDPLYSRAWTLLGLPCISLPLGQGANGMPIGMQFIGAEHADERLLAIAHAVHARS